MGLDDAYTYPGSGGVLINRWNLTDADQLDQAMNDIASTQWAVLRRETPPRVVGLGYLCTIHRQLFGELFDWAGESRTVDVGAQGTGLAYCRPAFIDEHLTAFFSRLMHEDYLRDARTVPEFTTRLADRWGELTQIHPFRDGNTRSQSAYVDQLARRAGFTIYWSHIDVDQLREARMRAVTGIERPLATVLARATTPTDPDELRAATARFGPATATRPPVTMPDPRPGPRWSYGDKGPQR